MESKCRSNTDILRYADAEFHHLECGSDTYRGHSTAGDPLLNISCTVVFEQVGVVRLNIFALTGKLRIIIYFADK